jgi:hypothetical protein
MTYLLDVNVLLAVIWDGAGLRTRSRQSQFSISQNRLVISAFNFANF